MTHKYFHYFFTILLISFCSWQAHKFNSSLLRLSLFLAVLVAINAGVVPRYLPSQAPVIVTDRLQRGIVPPTAPQADAARAIESTFLVRRDHFTTTDTTTFSMRYFDSDVFFRAGGPIFIFVGGESEANQIWLQTGHMFDMAREYGGHMFHTEHRYYGSSFPVPNGSTDNLKWLTVDQAIADLVAFVTHAKQLYPALANSKVILTGGSYAANMVAWARDKYPSVFAGAWASSGPILAKVDFFEYKEAMNDAYLKYGGSQCHLAIKNAFASMEAQVAAGQSSNLDRQFNLCFPIETNNQLDVWNFFSSMTNILAGPVQYYRNSEIQTACAYIQQYPDPVEGLASYVRAIYGSNCISTNYDYLVQYYSQPSLVGGGQYRQWMYQTCREFGYYQTSSSDKQVFGTMFPYDLNVALCHDVYNGVFNNATVFENIAKTNEEYGGLLPKASNVIYTNGDIDPWARISLLEAAGENVYVEMIPDSSHCADIYSNAAGDSPEMRRVRALIMELVGQWIRE